MKTYMRYAMTTKQIITTLMLCVCVFSGVQAQRLRVGDETSGMTIQNGSKWWDGGVLYTATVEAEDVVRMNGISEHEGGYSFILTKVYGKPGQYQLYHDVHDDYLPVRGKSGARVDHIRQDDFNFLVIRRQNGDACHTLDSMSDDDDIRDCVVIEHMMERHDETNLPSGMLFNTTYLSKFPKHQLRLMRNTILAYHGYRFQSKDLQEYFSAQPWYEPGSDNNAIKLDIIEQTNVQLIKSEEALSDDLRGYTTE